MSKLKSLSDEQIEDIVSAMPPCLAATAKAAELMRNQIMNKLRSQLKMLKLVDNPEAIQKLKDAIIMQHYNSLVPAGEPVGIRAAEAISQPTTQGALNAFHTAGAAATVATGIDAVRELYNVPERRKRENVYMHFCNQNYTFEEIIDLRRELVGVTINDLIYKKSKTFLYTKEDEPWWYNTYLDVHTQKKKFPFNRDEVFDKDDSRNMYLRLYFNLNMIYQYNLTLWDISERLNEKESIFAIPSPSYEGFIDIFVDSNIAKELDKKTEIKGKGRDKVFRLAVNPSNTVSLFIQMALIPAINDSTNIISGIYGVTGIFPKEANIISMFKNEVPLTDITNDFNDKGKFRIYLDTVNIKMNNIPISKIYAALGACDMTVLFANEKYFDVFSEKLIPGDNPESDKKSPSKIMKEMIKKDNQMLDAKVEEEKMKGVKYPERGTTYLLRTTSYFYALSNGTNLMRVLAHPLIDSSRTYSTNPREMLAAFGVEAARNFMILTYIETLDSYLNPRHIALIADFQTSKGTLLPITSKGIARQGSTGPLAQASFEQPMEAFINAAAFGKIEDIKSTSTSIFVGKRMILGTGCFKARIDIEAIEKAEVKYEEYKKLHPELFEATTVSDEQAFESNAMDDESALQHTDDDISNIGLIGVQSIQGLGMRKDSEFKVRNPVPFYIKIDLGLPEFIRSIINPKIDILQGKLNIDIKSSVSVNKPNLVTLTGSLSKPGLPALPKLNAIQLTSLGEKPLEKEIKIDELDFESDFDLQ